MGDLLVSATLIIRDEAARLERCLASIAPVVDEIVVVDTGSVDASRDIARSFGARLFEQPWQRDFSLRRNHALAQAHGEWAFVIDGDEDLTSARELRATIEAAHAVDDVDGATVWVDALDDAGQVVDQVVSVRA